MTKDTYPTLSGAEVAAIRTRHRLGIVPMADLLGVSPYTVENWERGLRTCRGANAHLLMVLNDRGPYAVANSVRQYKAKEY